MFQSVRRYAPTGRTAYDTWQAEFVGESVQDDPADAAVRNPDQTLIWDFWRP